MLPHILMMPPFFSSSVFIRLSIQFFRSVCRRENLLLLDLDFFTSSGNTSLEQVFFPISFGNFCSGLGSILRRSILHDAKRFIRHRQIYWWGILLFFVIPVFANSLDRIFFKKAFELGGQKLSGIILLITLGIILFILFTLGNLQERISIFILQF